MNRKIPGNKKLWNGELSNSDSDIPINVPLGEIIKREPPPRAPKPRNASKINSMFLALVVFMPRYILLNEIATFP
jgi:hypothetical protein